MLPADEQLIQIAKKPPTANTYVVVKLPGHIFADCQAIIEERKIHARIESELQRTPESSVHFHQLELAVAVINLKLHHRRSLPAQRLQELVRFGHNIVIAG